MLAIQILLIVAAAVLFTVFVRRAHSVRLQAAKRIGFILFIGLNVYAVLRPDDTTWVAQRLGVGRGADLLLYVLVVVFAFYSVNTYLRFKNIERRLTQLARSIALRDAQAPEPLLEPAAEPAERDEVLR